MNRFKELKIWQTALDLAADIYEATKSFPKEEVYGLTNQIRRSAVSISSNIAEGANRNGDKEFLHFLSIASGSAGELETQLLIANRLKYLTDESLNNLIAKITSLQNMNFKLQSTLKQRIKH